MRGILDRFWEKRRERGSVEVRPADVDAAAGGIEEHAGRNVKSKTWETSVSRVESWPVEARPLKQHTWISYLYLFFDVVLVLLPVFFILLSIAVITLDGKPTKGNDLGKKVEFVIDLGPTIFPIVFAAVSGRSMKMIARFLAERGAKISTLELLMASQSVWGTVESQLLMQRATVVGVNLLFLWALSPLGGQASLRLMSRGDQASYTSRKLRYLSTGPGATVWGLGTTYVGGGKWSDTNGLYAAALLAPQATKLSPRDPWGNVKIPSLRNANLSTADSNGWVSIPADIARPEMYTSLVGLPIVGLPSGGISNLTLEYTYIDASCGDIVQKDYPYPNGTTSGTKVNNTHFDDLVDAYVWKPKNQSDPFEPYSRTTSFFLDTNRQTSFDERDPLIGRLDGFMGFTNHSRLSEKELQSPREIIWVSRYSLPSPSVRFGLNVATCSLAQNHIEAMVHCSGIECVVQKIRISQTDTRPTNLTGFEHALITTEFVKRFATAMDTQIGSSPTERFVADTSSFPYLQRVGQIPASIAYVDLSRLSAKEFSDRASLVLNTFYQLSTQPTGYFDVGTLPKNLSAYGPDTLPVTDINVYLPANLSATEHSFFDYWRTFDRRINDVLEGKIESSPFIGATTNASVTAFEQMFICNYAWVALLLSSSGVLFFTGAVALLLKRKTLGPEMFGFVSSMTYENPWVKIPQGGTMLDAMERSRLLKDVKVYIGDVRGNEDEGHIALAAGVPLRKLERGRLYA